MQNSEQIRKKKSKLLSINQLEKRLKNKLTTKYKLKFQFYLIKEIDKITEGDICKQEIRYKDNLIYINQEESLNRYYIIGESIIRLKNYIEFYMKLKDYLQINYEILDQKKIMFKNNKRKFKLDKRLIKDIKNKKRRGLVMKNKLLKESTIYLEKVYSNNSIKYINSFRNSENIEKFECLLREHQIDESVHDIYDPHFSSDESFFCDKLGFKNKVILDFNPYNELDDEEFSIDSIITDSSLEKIDESCIEKKINDISSLNIYDVPIINDIKVDFKTNSFLPQNISMKKKKKNNLSVKNDEQETQIKKKKNTFNKKDLIEKGKKLNYSYKKNKKEAKGVKKENINDEIKKFFEKLQKLKNKDNKEKETKKLKLKDKIKTEKKNKQRKSLKNENKKSYKEKKRKLNKMIKSITDHDIKKTKNYNYSDQKLKEKNETTLNNKKETETEKEKEPLLKTKRKKKKKIKLKKQKKQIYYNINNKFQKQKMYSLKGSFKEVHSLKNDFKRSMRKKIGSFSSKKSLSKTRIIFKTSKKSQKNPNKKLNTKRISFSDVSRNLSVKKKFSEDMKFSQSPLKRNKKKKNKKIKSKKKIKNQSKKNISLSPGDKRGINESFENDYNNDYDYYLSFMPDDIKKETKNRLVKLEKKKNLKISLKNKNQNVI